MWRSWLIIWVCCIPFLLAAQDFKQVLLAMKQQYKDAERMHIVMEIKVYEKEGGVNPFFSERAVVRRDGLNYSYKYGQMEMVMNERCMLLIDHHEKEILYRVRDVKSEKEYMSKYNFNLDSMLTFYDTPQYLGLEKETDHYRLIQKAGDIKQMDLYVLPQTSLLKKMTYTYQQGQFVAIDFVVFDAAPVFNVEEFDEKKIITRAKGKIVPASPYGQYRMSIPTDERPLNK